MAITQVDIIQMSEKLQGKVESFQDIIPASTKMDIQELFGVLMKMFRKGLKMRRKDLYLLNILVAMDSIIDELLHCGQQLDEDQVEDSRKLKEEYLEYAEKMGKTNEEILKKVSLFSKYIYIDEPFYNSEEDRENSEEDQEEIKEPEKSEEEQKQEMLDKITSSFKSLNIENEDFRKELEQLKKEKRGLQRNLASKDKQLATVSSELTILRRNQKEHDKIVERLNNKVEKLTEVVNEQEKTIEKSASKNKLYESQQAELLKLKEELSKYQKKEKILINQNTPSKKETFYNRVKLTIMDILMHKTCTFQELENYLFHLNMALEREELLSCLKEIQDNYSMKTAIGKNGLLAYHIDTPQIVSNQRIKIPVSKKIMDIALTSDWHLYSLDNNDLKKIDTLYDYCAKNNVNIIFNLGDFFDPDFDFSIGKERAKLSSDVLKRVSRFANVLPYDKNINQYLMGGNHDEYLKSLKIDVIDYLSTHRPDIFNLGYYHAFIDVNDAMFALHHPKQKCDILKEYQRYLKTFYDNNRDVNCDNLFMNLFGHFHNYRYFPNDGYISVPSLTRDSKGAVHLKVHLDVYGNVEYVQIIPLTLSNNRLQKNKEHTYHKSLKNR